MTSDERKAAIRRRDEIDGQTKELYRQIYELGREWNEITRQLDDEGLET
jgi:hypothetical protein